MTFAPWQLAVYTRLDRSLRDGKLGHALLFAGPARMGKLEVARALAGRLLCNSPVPGPSPRPSPGVRGGVGAERESLAAQGAATFACGACRSCNFLSAGTHPDHQFVSFEPTDKGDKLRTELVVDQIRRLGEWFSKTAQFGGAQVVVVEPAEALNTAAANALLKTLEEPAGHRYLLLVTSRPGRLPATIRSRCQRLEFVLPVREDALAWLVSRGHAPDAADAALDAARGQPGLADHWLATGGLALRAEVQAELDAVGRGRASPIVTAQRWLGDEHGEQRLRFAADVAVDVMAQVLGARPSSRKGSDAKPYASAVAAQRATREGLVAEVDAAALATWFDALNRMRTQLPAPLRHDLILAGLLGDWRTMLATGSGPGHGGQHR